MNKSTPWMAVLVVLVFGLGWTAHGVNDRVGPPSWDGKDRGDRHERDERGSRGPSGFSFGRSSGGWSDPFRGTFSGFADELNITDEQRAQMDAVWATLTQEVKGLEKDIWSLHGKARVDIHNILEEQQKELYTQLINDSFAKMRDAKITRVEEWVRDNTTLTDADVAEVMAIYRAGEDERARTMSFRGSSRHRSQESHEGSKTEGDRDEKLLKYLSKQQIEEMRNVARRMWGGRRP